MKTSKLFITISIILLMLLIGFSSGIVLDQFAFSSAIENPDSPVTPVDPDEPGTDEPGTDEPEDPVVTTSVSDFKFNGNTITLYIGNETEVVVPTSYSLGELKTITYQVEDGMVEGGIFIDEIITPILESGQTVKFIFADDSSVEVDFDEYFMDPAMSMEAVAVEIQEYEFIEGDDIQVTAMEGTFANNKTIVSVDLSQTSIKTLSGTFNHCTSLDNVLLPATIEEIDNSCFNGCTFESIDLSNTNLKILGGFQQTTIKTVILPNSLTYINGSTFFNSKLEYIDLSNTQITSLSRATFSMCEELTYVILPSTVTEINALCFQSCSALEALVIPTQEVIDIDVSEFSNTFYNSSPTIYVPANLLDSFKITYPDLADRFVAID